MNMFLLATCLFLGIVIDIYFTLFLVEQGLKPRWAAVLGIIALYFITYIFTNIFIQFNGYL